MNITEQRIAIAEACGLVPCDSWWRFNTQTMAKGDCSHEKCYPTNFPAHYESSLDAMHQAEATLTDDQQLEYIHALCGGRRDSLWNLSWDSAFLCANAPASVKAKAFLRALGKWKDSAPI